MRAIGMDKHQSQAKSYSEKGKPIKNSSAKASFIHVLKKSSPSKIFIHSFSPCLNCAIACLAALCLFNAYVFNCQVISLKQYGEYHPSCRRTNRSG
jgi:hypothetical protein